MLEATAKMIELCDTQSCTACGACVQICPQKAIELKENEFAFLSPHIDPQLCISCGLCRKSCPILTPQKKNRALTCYASWTKDIKDRKGSSSGGIAYLLGKRIIADGGVVFGCCFTSDGTAKQCKIETLEQLEATRGSKYLKSSTDNTYQETKKLLQSGRRVFWVGTPCQIAGLYSFLGKRDKNLITADLICHGVPPAKYWKEYQKLLFSNCPKHTFVFRDNINGYAMQTYVDQKLSRKRGWMNDSYYYAFMYAIDCNENCYSCRFASPERVGDLTIGDFWGLNRKTCSEKVPSFPSIILVNTIVGKTFLHEMQNELVLLERDIQEGIAGNDQLQKPSVRHKLRDKFL